MKVLYRYEVISFAGSRERRTFDYFGCARDYAFSVHRDSVQVFLLRRPVSPVSLDYVAKVWRVEGSLEARLDPSSVLELLAYLL